MVKNLRTSFLDSMPRYFDIHSHLDAAQYDADRAEVLKRLQETNTHTITIGTDLASSKRAVELADTHEGVYACIGILAVDNREEFDTEEFGKLVVHPKVVAIGECGLDFFYTTKEEDYERQKKIFIDQIEFAIAHGKPLMIHVRNAYEEVLEILETYQGRVRGNIHFFASTPEMAERFFALGFTISFTGVITFAREYDEVIRRAPLDRIMSETDAPYVAPVPYRGKRNEPAYVQEVVARIAEIRGEDPELVQRALVQNALNMIG
jgi:TatD DNase family protein